jgi:hypothetical protein
MSHTEQPGTSGPGSGPYRILLPFISAERKPIVSEPVTPFVFKGDLRDLALAEPLPEMRFDYTRPGPISGDTEQRNVQEQGFRDPVWQTGPTLIGATALTPPVQDFDGISFTGWRPPDTVGDVGPEHYIQMVNNSFAIWEKDNIGGGPVIGPIFFNSLWDDKGGLCETANRGDPIVLYDHLADRWLLSQFTFDTDADDNPIGPFHQCIAISRTGDPTVPDNWFLYDFTVHNTKFNDYPKFGVWPDAYYMSANQFGGTGGAGAWAFDRANMLNGNPAIFVYFDVVNERYLLPSDLDGPTLPPAGSPNYFVRFQEGGGPDRLEIFEFDVNFGAPGSSTFTGPDILNTAAFDSQLCTDNEFCIPQPNTTKRLATLSHLLMWRLQYRNFGAFETLVTNHSVDVDGNDHAGIRWYELQQAGGGGWAIQQQGTFAPDADHRWMGSVAMDEAGNMALGYSVASSNVFPSIRYTARFAGDPPGLMTQGEFTLINGTGSQIATQKIKDKDGKVIRERGRWGDYSSMNVDPVDDCTFWYTQEYIPTDGDWRTRVGAFRFPACSQPPTADASGSYETNEGTDKILDGSASSDPNGDPLIYEWDLDNDGNFDDATGPTPIFNLVGQDGVFPVALRVTDPEGLFDIDETTVTVNNIAPGVNLNSDAPQDEGAIVTVSGAVSDPGWLDPLSATIDWADGSPVETVTGALENTRPDATFIFAISHVYGDNGMYNVEVCAADDDTTDNCETIVVQIENVPPTVTIDPGQVTEIDEGDFVEVLANFSDPGWLDTFTSLIDWGTPAGDTDVGNLVVSIEGPPLDQGQVTGSHQYGDNGLFAVTVTVTDDDGGAGSVAFDLAVNNIDPSAEIDETHSTLVNGIPAFMAHTGEPLDFSGHSTDPGSDDLFLSWDWDDGPPAPDVTTTYLVKPPDPDPFPSPSVQPRDITDEQTRAFADACLYEISFLADDDDRGHGEDQAFVIITGNADKARSEGYWQHQYSGNGNIDFDQETLECYLAIVDFVSTVFNEERDASTIEKAYDVLFLKQNQGSETEQFDRELLTVWLNFANGALEFTDITDVVSKAEGIRLDPNATDKEIREQTRILHQLNN